MSVALELRWRVVRWPVQLGAFVAPGMATGVREAVLVEARGADGVGGLGEAAPLPGRSRDDIADVERALAALAVRAPFGVSEVADVWRIAAEVDPDAPAACFAVEVALLDVLARRAGCDVARLLNADAPDAVPTAIVVGDAAAARAAWAAGARCLKVKVGAGRREDERPRLERIAAAAPGARLRLDANQAWPEAEVAARMAALADLPIDFVEEPCANLARLIGTPLALPVGLDESLAESDPATLDALLTWPAVGALVLKPTILGGVGRCRALAARARGPVIISHALEGPLGTAACAELARALGRDAAAGVGAHPALAGWPIGVPQIAGGWIRRAAAAGLGLGALGLAEVGP